jgi:NAD(P)-dependent dehydrogenase (short-subunit alcohol dehydrogenase family)
MDLRLKDRVALVTGASKGIGKNIARGLANEGVHVILLARGKDDLERAAEEIRDATGVRVLAVPTDMRDTASVKAAASAAADRFGTVHILVNNAYVAGGFARFEHKPDGHLELAFRGGPEHTWRAMRAAFPHMKGQQWGRIINLVSLNGINAHKYSADYNAAKEAIRAITRTAAVEWGRHNILCNCIAPAAASPAYVAFASAAPENAKEMLKQNPLGRMGDPEHDIGGVALFFASDDSDYVTGNTIFASGGTQVNGVQWDPPMPD